MIRARKILFAAVPIISMSHAPVVAQETDKTGQIAFNTYCRQCHSMKKGDNRLGPSLHGIFGKKAGQVKGYPNYSGSLQENITWDEATLDKFIADPPSVAPNTNMIYSSVADAAKRKKIIKFLRAKSQPRAD